MAGTTVDFQPKEDAMEGSDVAAAAVAHAMPPESIGRAVSRDAATAFGDVVAVLMRSPFHRSTFVPELEWLVAPGVASGQFAIAHRTDPKTGAQTAISFMLWAMVSPEVSKRLAGVNAKPKLKPEEWMSGDIPWLVEAAGESDTTRNLLKSMVAKRFATTGINFMQMAPDGKYRPTRLEHKDEAPPVPTVN
jgi:cytolysin-activating lysine-acyltransferase